MKWIDVSHVSSILHRSCLPVGTSPNRSPNFHRSSTLFFHAVFGVHSSTFLWNSLGSGFLFRVIRPTSVWPPLGNLDHVLQAWSTQMLQNGIFQICSPAPFIHRSASGQSLNVNVALLLCFGCYATSHLFTIHGWVILLWAMGTYNYLLVLMSNKGYEWHPTCTFIQSMCTQLYMSLYKYKLIIHLEF